MKPKMYSFLVDDNSQHKKVNGVNKNDFAAAYHNKDVFLNNKCIRLNE